MSYGINLMLKRLLLSLVVAFIPVAADAASQNVYSSTPSGAIVSSQLFYCPTATGPATGTDLKCTAAQIAAFNYSLMSGGCTATSAGVVTCLAGSLSGLGGGVASALSATLNGTGSLVATVSPALATPSLGTPTAITLTNGTGLPLSTGVTGNLSVNNLGSGTGASATTFWRGDSTWATPAGGGGGGSGIGPGYVANVYYVPIGLVGKGSNATVPSVTTAVCAVGWFGNMAGSTSGSIGEIAIGAVAAGTTTVQTAIYANDTSIIPNRPGTRISFSNAVSTVTGQPITLYTSGSLAANMLYWVCLQAGDLSFQYASQLAGAIYQSPYLQYIGTNGGQFGQGGNQSFSGVSTTTGITSYGTWPTTFHGATFTESTLGPWFGFAFNSIP
jgi:hypothetical protein